MERASSGWPGSSTLTTSAPRRAMVYVAYGPARKWHRSTTRRPDSGPGDAVDIAQPSTSDRIVISRVSVLVPVGRTADAPAASTAATSDAGTVPPTAIGTSLAPSS